MSRECLRFANVFIKGQIRAVIRPFAQTFTFSCYHSPMNNLLNRNPLPWVALLSFMLSLALSYNHLVNLDGILYLQVAKAFMQHDYAQAFALYGWPFYSALIAGLSMITPLSLEHSATLINAGLMGLMGAGFVALVRELGGDKTIQWIAVLVFLAHTGINGYREYIIRDFGAWALMLWSMVYLCRISKQSDWKNIVGWTVTAIAAVLFRPENIAWLALGPLVLLTMKQNLACIIKTYSLTVSLAALMCLGVLIFGIKLPLDKLGGLFGVVEHLLVVGADQYSMRAQALREIMSPELKYHHATIILGFALFSYLIFSIIKILSPLYFILVGYAAVRRPLIPAPQARIVIWLLMLYGFMYLGFLAKNYFISSRYLIPFIAALMVWVPFALKDCWSRAPNALKLTLALVMIYMFLDGVVHTGYSKQYLRQAGLWINQHTPAQAVLYTENKQVAYYADRPLTTNPNAADVIAIYYSRKAPEAHLLIESLSKDQQVDFHNKREDGVRVILNPSSRETRGSYPNTD